jgi:hypothetical protein
MSMNVTVSGYPDVRERALQLGCNSPTGIAIIPKNFTTAATKQALVHQQSTPIIRALWQQAGIVETRIEKSGDIFPTVQEKTLEWIGPIIFFSAAIISQNQDLISISLGILSNYLTDLFKGMQRNKGIILDIVVEKTKGKQYKHIHFEGSLSELQQAKLDELVSGIQKEN